MNGLTIVELIRTVHLVGGDGDQACAGAAFPYTEKATSHKVQAGSV